MFATCARFVLDRPPARCRFRRVRSGRPSGSPDLAFFLPRSGTRSLSTPTTGASWDSSTSSSVARRTTPPKACRQHRLRQPMPGDTAASRAGGRHAGGDRAARARRARRPPARETEPSRSAVARSFDARAPSDGALRSVGPMLIGASSSVRCWAASPPGSVLRERVAAHRRAADEVAATLQVALGRGAAAEHGLVPPARAIAAAADRRTLQPSTSRRRRSIEQRQTRRTAR